jgi:hypothetical protein
MQDAQNQEINRLKANYERDMERLKANQEKEL